MKSEDQNIEYKQNWRDEYLRWICGFANADGGRMLIGVSDDKKGNEILGVPDWKSLLEIIPNLMKNTMGMIADVNHIREKGKDLVEIVVPSYPVPISLRGVYYVRRGATNLRLSGPGLESFLLKCRGLHWENLLGKHSSRPYNPTIASCVCRERISWLGRWRALWCSLRPGLLQKQKERRWEMT